MGIVTRELRVRCKDAGGEDELAALRPPGRHVHRARGPPRHPWRRRRDLADAAFPARTSSTWRKADNFVSNVARAEKEFALLRHTGTHAFAWIASDLNPNGVVGDAGDRDGRERPADGRASGRRFHQPAAGCAQGEAGRLAGVTIPASQLQRVDLQRERRAFKSIGAAPDRLDRLDHPAVAPEQRRRRRRSAADWASPRATARATSAPVPPRRASAPVPRR